MSKNKHLTKAWFIENVAREISIIFEEYSVPYSLRPNFVTTKPIVAVQAVCEAEKHSGPWSEVIYLAMNNGYVLIGVSLKDYLVDSEVLEILSGYRIFTPGGWMHSSITNDDMNDELILCARNAIERMLKTFGVVK